MQEWAQCVKIAGCNITFRLRGETEIVAANPDVADFLGKSINAAGDDKKYVCLITGEKTVPVMTHGGFSIGGSAGVKLVSFQTSRGYDSYYKEQGENAPVSLYAELAYTSALSTLLSGKSNRLGIGGLQMVFWSDSEKSEIENVFGSLFGIPAKDNPDGWVSSISALYKSVFSGREQILEDRKFFVLGLAANKARMIVRFFVADTERARRAHCGTFFGFRYGSEVGRTPTIFGFQHTFLHIAEKQNRKNSSEYRRCSDFSGSFGRNVSENPPTSVPKQNPRRQGNKPHSRGDFKSIFEQKKQNIKQHRKGNKSVIGY